MQKFSKWSNSDLFIRIQQQAPPEFTVISAAPLGLGVGELGAEFRESEPSEVGKKALDKESRNLNVRVGSLTVIWWPFGSRGSIAGTFNARTRSGAGEGKEQGQE